MNYMAKIKNYVSEHAGELKKAAKVGALTGLTAIVLATSGCFEQSSSRGWKLTLAELEYGAKQTRSKDLALQKQVIDADAKYSDTVDVVPGKGLGISYQK